MCFASLQRRERRAPLVADGAVVLPLERVRALDELGPEVARGRPDAQVFFLLNGNCREVI